MSTVVSSVRPAPEGFADGCVALVTFSFATDDFTGAAKITRFVKARNAEEQDKVYVIGRVVGKVQVIDAPLMKRAEDKHAWLQSGTIVVPDEIRRDVAEQAWAKVERAKRQAAAPAQSRNPAPADEINEEGIPF